MTREGTRLLDQGLPLRVREILDQAGRIAEDLGMGLWLVGGAVRDLLIGRAPADYDLTVVGSARDLAEALAERLGGVFTEFPRFGTAMYRHPELALDLVSTRREFYERPGKKPRVELDPAGLDLLRRDFTVNAIALGLTPRDRGRIEDPFEGRLDVTRQELRILHAGSFVDDPSRIFRGVRYLVRLGFDFEPATRQKVVEAVTRGAITTLEPDLLFKELKECFELGAVAPAALDELLDLGIIESLAPGTGNEDRARARRALALAAEVRSRGVEVKEAAYAAFYHLFGRDPGRRARAAALFALPGRWDKRFAGQPLDPALIAGRLNGKLALPEALALGAEPDSGEVEAVVAALVREYGRRTG